MARSARTKDAASAPGFRQVLAYSEDRTAALRLRSGGAPEFSGTHPREPRNNPQREALEVPGGGGGATRNEACIAEATAHSLFRSATRQATLLPTLPVHY